MGITAPNSPDYCEDSVMHLTNILEAGTLVGVRTRECHQSQDPPLTDLQSQSQGAKTDNKHAKT